MSYNFKEDLASRLPKGYSIQQIYAIDENTTQVEGVKDSIKTLFKLSKVDVTPLFSKLPVIGVLPGLTMNDLYGQVDDIYGLGLLQDIDYYDSTKLNPSSVPQYVELPISNNSYGYKGMIRCYMVTDAFTGVNLDVNRDVSNVDITPGLNKLKFRNFLMGSVIGIPGINFIGDMLSLEFVTNVIAAFKGNVPDNELSSYQTLLTVSRLVGTYSDGLSDVAVVISNQELFQIRYLDTLKNNEVNDNTSDNSKGLTDGDTDSSAENPVSGEGDYINTERSEDPYSSTEGTTEEDVNIEIE